MELYVFIIANGVHVRRSAKLSLRACLEQVGVKVSVLWRTPRTCLRAPFASNASKTEEAFAQNNSRETVPRVKEADLAPPSHTLLLTNHALKAKALAGVHPTA